MWALLGPQINLPAMRETQVQSLGGEDSLERGYLLQYPCLEKFMDRGAWQARVQWVTRRHDRVTKHSAALHYHCKGSMKDSKDRTLGLER